MSNNNETSSHLFTISYSGRELSCLVERRSDQLDVLIDNNMSAVLQVTNDGSLRQISGNELGDAIIAFIKKQVIENVNGVANS
jgi:hypothetical protein